MKIATKTLGILIIFIVIGGISISMATNYWTTETSKVPRRLDSGIGYDPGDIRGSYTFADVSQAFDIPLETLRLAFSIPKSYDIASFQNKMLEELYHLEGNSIEVGNGSVKMVVSLYTKLPYDYISTGDYIPLMAFELLDEKGLIPDDKREYIQSHTVDLSIFEIQDSSIESESTDELETTTVTHEENKINRNTTFNDLLSLGLSEESIYKAIGGKYSSSLQLVSSYCEENEVKFGEIKTKLQNLVNKLN